jgi:tetratricopeptide (TPR) repeat protein
MECMFKHTLKSLPMKSEFACDPKGTTMDRETKSGLECASPESLVHQRKSGKQVFVVEEKAAILSYPEAAAECMPMFAENRVHQRTSGRPYPNRVVLKVERQQPCDKKYTIIRLENDYLSIGILPELGGRIFWAKDKTTGYDFFYRQHVVKPALIGVLGSWISGGLEFNWPFHHRPSTFMPVDYAIENGEDGSVTVWLSEHDPMDRMKGMVGICLRPDEAMLETRVQLANRTPVAKSFLWWENAAVPVNNNYQIFFPPDVSYVNFHYHRSVTTWPMASGDFNGIRLGDNVDIRQHKNTKSPTSYFSAASQYDFFGGYDHGKSCGVVHVANHHISPGKKLFTWAYNQLSKSWERALTDKDGAYAELMAGTYTDNQPDFSWLEPFETKKFSQYWYPIGAIGAPSFANTCAALSLQRNSQGISLRVQAVRTYEKARIVIRDANTTLCDTFVDLLVAKPLLVSCPESSEALSVRIEDCRGHIILEYVEKPSKAELIPVAWGDLREPDHFKTAQELHLAGVHVEQYRSPNALPDVYWKAALQRDPDYVPALIDLGCFQFKRGLFGKAQSLLEKARNVVNRHNSNPRSGELHYILGLVSLFQEKTNEAYEAFYKATWNEAQRSRSMTMIAAIDGRRGDFGLMLVHAEQALENGADNPLAGPLAAAAELRSGAVNLAISRLDLILAGDPLNHLARYLRLRASKESLTSFFKSLKSSPSQTCLDLAFDLLNAGMNIEARELLQELPIEVSPMVGYTLGVLSLKNGDVEQAGKYFFRAENAGAATSFPFRLEELEVLRCAVKHNPALFQAWYYLGCLLYDKGRYTEAANCWRKSIAGRKDFFISYRNLAVAYYSHLNQKDQVLPMLKKAHALAPGNDQLVYEISHVMAKLGTAPAERVNFISGWCKNRQIRDDLILEWARALNQMDRSDSALELLCNHSFVPCEGGEHAVAEQYMFAHHNLGRNFLFQGRYDDAIAHFRSAQVLPDNLGSGLWNEALLVPHQYYEAVSLCRQGKEDSAKEICQHILNLSVGYFSEMHLPELPVYQALAMKLLGKEARADHSLRMALTRWTEALDTKDAEHFKTTPFFISYMDNPEQARIAHFRYLIGMARAALQDRANALNDFRQSVDRDPSSLYPWVEIKHCSL